MKFTNVVAYCKGWYAHRGDIEVMWMDLVHCIHADGWSVYTKKDVAQWCMHRLDEWRDQENLRQLTFSWFISSVDQNRWLYDNHRNDGKKLSFEDAIIWAFYSFVGNLDGKYFTEGVRPSSKILPFGLRGSSYYPDFKDKFEFSEMMCDRLAAIEKMFPDYPEQVVKEYDTFEHREGSIMGKDWKNVVVLPGTDSLLECTEALVTGRELNASCLDSDDYLDMNIYYHCKFDKDTKYLVRFTNNIVNMGTEWERVEHTVKSIREV